MRFVRCSSPILRLAVAAGLALVFVSPSFAAAEPARHRVIVSTDIGGTDPDDNQSIAHLLVYADAFDVEGLISSPYGAGRKQDLLDAIDVYAQDFSTLKPYSSHYPSPKFLRSISKQGAIDSLDDAGVGTPTEGSDWIVRCARTDDPRPLWVLIWGGIDDLAQALHDAPDILPKLRVYYVGGPNKKWGANAYNYIERHHPNLWIIEANSTYSGWFTGGNQKGEWGNKEFVTRHIAGHGALGRYFARFLDGTMKMGDTPSLVYLLGKNPEDPTLENWGGSFVRAWERPRVQFTGLTTKDQHVEQYAIVEITFPPGHGVTPERGATLQIDNQTLPGFIDETGALRFRLSPKMVKPWSYMLHAEGSPLDGKMGAFTSFYASADSAAHPSARTPHWWTDSPNPRWQEGTQQGARTVNRWREDFLRDFAARMDRCVKAQDAKE